MALIYSHLYRLPTTCLGFFAVYGPWGRPNMANFLFVGAILTEKPIKGFNHCKMKREFTFTEEIVKGVLRVVDCTATPDSRYDSAQADPATCANYDTLSH